MSADYSNAPAAIYVAYLFFRYIRKEFQERLPLWWLKGKFTFKAPVNITSRYNKKWPLEIQFFFLFQKQMLTLRLWTITQWISWYTWEHNRLYTVALTVP